jgi:hypothetical protein
MNDTFFTQLSQFKGIKATIAISTDANGLMMVSFLPKPLAVSDTATEQIHSFNIKGTGAEIDERFFNSISKPLEQTIKFFDNSENYMKNLKAAEAKSKRETDKKAKIDKLKKEIKTLLEDTAELAKNDKKIRVRILEIKKLDPTNKFASDTVQTLDNNAPQAALFNS